MPELRISQFYKDEVKNQKFKGEAKKFIKDKTHFDISGNDEKSPFGPIIGPKPGPTFEMDVAAPERAVIKSRPVKDNNAAKIKKITK